MFKLPSQLNSEIDAAITDNGVGDITGPVMNTLLKSLVSSFGGSYFLFPKDGTLETNDIGHLVMNDGSGTAKLYQLSPATTEQLGRFVIRITGLGDTLPDSTIDIKNDIDGLSFSQSDWRDGDTPATPLEELEMIKDFIDNEAALSYLTTSIVSDELVIEESAFHNTTIELENFDIDEVLFVDTASRAALPEAPTAFPLGKLIAIDGDNAVISSNSVETYPLEGTFTIDHNCFNNENDIDFDDLQVFYDLAKIFIVPAEDGKVKPIDFSEIPFDEYFKSSFRHHFVGIALHSTANTVTVMHLNQLSLIASILVKAQQKGLFNNN